VVDELRDTGSGTQLKLTTADAATVNSGQWHARRMHHYPTDETSLPKVGSAFWHYITHTKKISLYRLATAQSQWRAEHHPPQSVDRLI
jgi:hypothetical protein